MTRACKITFFLLCSVLLFGLSRSQCSVITCDALTASCVGSSCACLNGFTGPVVTNGGSSYCCPPNVPYNPNFQLCMAIPTPANGSATHLMQTCNALWPSMGVRPVSFASATAMSYMETPLITSFIGWPPNANVLVGIGRIEKESLQFDPTQSWAYLGPGTNVLGDCSGMWTSWSANSSPNLQTMDNSVAYFNLQAARNWLTGDPNTPPANGYYTLCAYYPGRALFLMD